MGDTFTVIIRQIEALKQVEPELFPTDKENREAEEIRDLREAIAEIQEQGECVYYTST